MLAGSEPFTSAKFALFASIAREDLQRQELWTCAAYLSQDLGSKHQFALVQLRSQSSLLAAHQPGAAEEDEAVDRQCDGCDTRLRFLRDKLDKARAHQPPAHPDHVRRLTEEIKSLRDLLSSDPPEDWEHALFHCTKGDLPQRREEWMARITAIFEPYKPRILDRRGPTVVWCDLPTETQIQVALGTSPPDATPSTNGWFFWP